jgi:hypothetical protein
MYKPPPDKVRNLPTLTSSASASTLTFGSTVETSSCIFFRTCCSAGVFLKLVGRISGTNIDGSSKGAWTKDGVPSYISHLFLT